MDGPVQPASGRLSRAVRALRSCALTTRNGGVMATSCWSVAHMKRICPPWCVLALLLFSPMLIASADWPQFRGDAAQTGTAPETLPDQPALLWKVSTSDDGIE